MTSALAHRLAETIDALINALAEQMADQRFVHPARWLKEQGQ